MSEKHAAPPYPPDVSEAGLRQLEQAMAAENQGAEWVDIVDGATVAALIAEIRRLRGAA